LDFVLEFDGDFVLDKRFEEAVAPSLASERARAGGRMRVRVY